MFHKIHKNNIFSSMVKLKSYQPYSDSSPNGECSFDHPTEYFTLIGSVTFYIRTRKARFSGMRWNIWRHVFGQNVFRKNSQNLYTEVTHFCHFKSILILCKLSKLVRHSYFREEMFETGDRTVTVWPDWAIYCVSPEIHWQKLSRLLVANRTS